MTFVKRRLSEKSPRREKKNWHTKCSVKWRRGWLKFFTVFVLDSFYKGFSSFG